MLTEIVKHIHPIIVHFPIALIIVGFGYDFVLAMRKRTLKPAQGLWMWLLAAVGAWLAVVTGPEDDAEGITSFLEIHSTLATITAGVVSLIVVWRLLLLWRGHREFIKISLVLYLTFSLASCVLVLGTGYYGGKMVYTDGVGVTANGVPVNPPTESNGE